MEPKSRTIEQIQEGLKTVSEVRLNVGDLVFAAQSKDAPPPENWRVDYIGRIDDTSIYFTEMGAMPFGFAQKVTESEGRNILQTWKQVYP